MERYHHNYDDHKKKKILNVLIVDDDETVAFSLSQYIEFRGHNVYIIDEGARCVSCCQENNYDVIFMDYHMEGLDGAQVANIVKMEISKNAIIFAYTGDNSKRTINEIKKAGMIGAIIKSIEPEYIKILLQHLEKGHSLDKNIMKELMQRSKNQIMFFNL